MPSGDDLRTYLDSELPRFQITVSGEVVDFGFDVDHPAVVVVRSTTDALKKVSGGWVVEGIDRDLVWEIVGFSVDRSIVEALGDGQERIDLLSAVPAAGFDWTVIESDVP